jgi:hypothetical protein
MHRRGRPCRTSWAATRCCSPSCTPRWAAGIHLPRTPASMVSSHGKTARRSLTLRCVIGQGWKLAAEQPAYQPTPAQLPAALPTSEPADAAAPAAAAPEAAAAVPPPPPPPASPPSSAGQAAQPAVSGGAPAAVVADPRQAAGDPRQAAAAGNPRKAAHAGVTDSGPNTQGAPAPAASPATVSGASGLSLADILSSVQAAGSAGPGAAPTSGAPQPGSSGPGGGGPGPDGAHQQAIAAAAAMPALPAGLDLSSISALAAALGVSSSALGAAQQPQHPPAAPQPGTCRALHPRHVVCFLSLSTPGLLHQCYVERSSCLPKVTNKFDDSLIS